jgi:signal transduction histidine kinase
MLSKIFDAPKYLAVPSKDKKEFNQMYIITSTNEITNLAARINKNLKTLVTIVWEHNELDSNTIFDRDDTYSISVEKRPMCRLLKHITEDSDVSDMCKKCDEYHYMLIKSLITKIKFTLSKPNYFYSNYKNPDIEYNTDFKINYLNYHCPLLGYKEFLFPIVIDNIFLGAVFIGPILCKNDSKSQEIFNDFLTNNGNIIPDRSVIHKKNRFLRHDSSSKTSYVNLLKEMRKAECDERFTDENGLINFLTNRFKPLSDEEYNVLIKDSMSGINDLIVNLKELQVKKRENIIRKTIDNILDEVETQYNLYNNFMTVKQLSENYERILKEIFLKEMKQFGIKNIKILGVKKNPLIISKKMEVIISTDGNKKDSLVFYYNDLPDDLKQLHPWEPICNIQYGEQNSIEKYNHLFYELFKLEDSTESVKEHLMENHLILMYKEWLVLIELDVIELESNLLKIDKLKTDIYISFLNEAKYLFTSYLSRYELKLSEFISNKYQLTLRLYRHECAKIARAISTKNNKDYKMLINSIENIKTKEKELNLHDYKNFVNSIKDKNLTDACDDIDSNTKLIIHMADTIGLITERIKRENLDVHEIRSHFKIGHDIVEKLVKSNKYELFMNENNKSILIKNYRFMNYETLEEREISEEISIYHRKRLLDMVIYNLLDNALKYSHINSNIYITAGSDTTMDSAVFPFIIENIGTKIEPYPKAFELYYRGKEEAMTHIDGDGLGLYVVKRISDILNLEIKYKQEFISQYNIGYMNKYLSYGDNINIINEIELFTKTRKKYARFKDFIRLEEKKPVSDTSMTKKELEINIKRPTYYIRFEFLIQTNSDI